MTEHPQDSSETPWLTPAEQFAWRSFMRAALELGWLSVAAEVADIVAGRVADYRDRASSPPRRLDATSDPQGCPHM